MPSVSFQPLAKAWLVQEGAVLNNKHTQLYWRTLPCDGRWIRTSLPSTLAVCRWQCSLEGQMLRNMINTASELAPMLKSFQYNISDLELFDYLHHQSASQCFLFCYLRDMRRCWLFLLINLQWQTNTTFVPEWVRAREWGPKCREWKWSRCCGREKLWAHQK